MSPLFQRWMVCILNKSSKQLTKTLWSVPSECTNELNCVVAVVLVKQVKCADVIVGISDKKKRVPTPAFTMASRSPSLVLYCWKSMLPFQCRSLRLLFSCMSPSCGRESCLFLIFSAEISRLILAAAPFCRRGTTAPCEACWASTLKISLDMFRLKQISSDVGVIVAFLSTKLRFRPVNSGVHFFQTLRRFAWLLPMFLDFIIKAMSFQLL